MSSSVRAQDAEPTIRGVRLTEWRKQLDAPTPWRRERAIAAIGILGPKAEAAIPDLVRLMNSSHYDASVSQALARMGPAGVPPLAEFARDKKGQPRLHAIIALGSMGPVAKQAVPILRDVLDDPDPFTRHYAAEALGRIGADVAIPDLVRLLQDSEEHVRSKSIGALGSLGQKALPALTAALEDNQPVVRSGACRALAAMRAEAKPAVAALVVIAHRDTDNGARVAAIQGLGAIGPDAKAGVPILIEVIKGSNHLLRDAGLDAFAEIGPNAKDAVPTLIPMLQGNDRVQTALVKIGAPAAPALIEAMRRKPYQYLYAHMLARIDPFPIEALSKALHDEDQQMREGAAEALNNYRWNDDAVVKPLLGAMKDKTPRVRWFAVSALARTHRKDVLHAMADALHDDDLNVRQSAAGYFIGASQFAEPVAPALLAALKDKDSTVAANVTQAISTMSAKLKAQAAPILVERLKTIAPAQRIDAYNQIAMLGPDARVAASALTAALDDAEVKVVAAAAIALAKVGTPDEVVPIFTRAFKTGKPATRIGVASAMWQAGPDTDAAIASLIDALADPERGVRIAALYALSHKGAKARPALPTVLKILQDPSDAELFEPAIYVARDIGDDAKDAVPLLVKALEAKNKILSYRILDSLPRIGPEGTKAALAILMAELSAKDDRTFEDACQRLGKLGPAAAPAVPRLIEIVKTSQRHRAMQTLGEIGPAATDAVPVLLDILKQRNGGPDTVIEALGRIGPDAKAAIPELMIRFDEPNGWHHAHVTAWALGRMGPEAKEIVPGLVHMLNDPPGWTNRYLVCWVLGRIGPPAKDALPALERIVKETGFKEPPKKGVPIFRHWREGEFMAPKLVEVQEEFGSNLGWVASDAIEKIRSR
jgi:HEAT repeat protein